MAKITKRAKKFSQKGGPKAMLEKKGGSITKKGKVKGKAGSANNTNNKSNKSNSNNNANGDAAGLLQKKRREEDEAKRKELRDQDDFFAGSSIGTGNAKSGLGHLDMDSFFEQVANATSDDDDDDEGGSGSDSDDDDDDNRDKVAAKRDDNDDDDDDDLASLDSDDDDEDIEASEARMKAELLKMGDTDPEFLEYLKENESGLLEFGDNNNDDDDDDYDDEEMDEDDNHQKKKLTKKKKDDAATADTTAATTDDPFLLTPQRLTSLESSAFASHSLKGLKRILAAFKTACHLSDADSKTNGGDDSDDDHDDKTKKKKKREFQITSPVVFDRVMAICLMKCQDEFYFHLLGDGSGLNKKKDNNSDNEEEEDDDDDDDDSSSKEQYLKMDENKPLNPKQIMKSPHYHTLRPYIESFFKSTIHMLAEAGKEAALQKFVLSSLSKYIPYLTLVSPKGITKPLLKICTKLWSAPLDTSPEYQMVRLQAFLRIRQLAITQPFPFIEDCLKMTYLAYAQRSKFGTASNVTTVLPTLTFMGNCIVELYTLDYASAYQHAFVYIRQLALHLRTALMKKSPESMSVVYCWQYVHCLKLWVAVLSAACGGKGSTSSTAAVTNDNETKLGGGAGKDDEANLLRSLVYPLTEIILGVVRLIPIARYVPLRLHCVRLLQQLAACTESFIPTTFLLLGVLDMKEIGMKPQREGKNNNKSKNNKKGGGGGNAKSIKGLRLPLILKLPKEGTLRTMEQLDGVLREVFVLLNREVDLYRYSPGIPEFSFQILQRLRKFNKEISNGRWRAYSKGTIELCEKYSAFAIQARSTLVDAPKDVRRLEALKPSNTPSMKDRYDATVAKEKRLEAAAQPVVASSAKGKGAEVVDKGKKDGKKKRKNMDEDEDELDVLNSDDDDMEFEDEDVAESKKMKNKPKPKKRKAAVVNEADLKNVEALKEEDEVQEGVIWSDSESD